MTKFSLCQKKIIVAFMAGRLVVMSQREFRLILFPGSSISGFKVATVPVYQAQLNIGTVFTTVQFDLFTIFQLNKTHFLKTKV